MAVEPALYYVVVQEICDGEQAHALVVNHPAAHRFEAAKARTTALRVEIESLVESIGLQRVLVLQLAQVAQRGCGVNRQREEGRIRGDDWAIDIHFVDG